MEETVTTAAEVVVDTFTLTVSRAGTRYEVTLPRGGTLADLRVAAAVAAGLDPSTRLHLFLETVEVVGDDSAALVQLGLEALGPLAPPLTIIVDEGDGDASENEADSDDDADSVGSLVNFVVPDDADETASEPDAGPAPRSSIVDLDPSNILEPGSKRRRVPPRRFVHPDLVPAGEVAVAAVLAAAVSPDGDSDSEVEEDDGDYTPDEEEEDEEEDDDAEEESGSEEEWDDDSASDDDSDASDDQDT